MAEKKATKKATPKKVDNVASKTLEKVDYLKMSETELLKAITVLRQDIVTLKKGTVMGDVQNVRAHGAHRKELARALTALNTPREEK